MKTICMILPEFGYGGAEKSFCTLSVELAKKFNVTIVVFNLLSEPAYPTGGNILSLDVVASNNWISKIINFTKRVTRLKKIKKEIKPTYSISFLEGADYVNILSKKNEKVILSIRGSKIYDQNIQGLLGLLRHNFFLPTLYDKAHLIVALNEGIKDELAYTFGIKCPIEVIHNWIDFETVQRESSVEIDNKYKPIFENQVIISHGRLAVEKGFLQFLDVFKQILKEMPKLKFVLIGDGVEKQNLLNKCHELRLMVWDVDSDKKIQNNANIYFLGYQSNPYCFLKKADVYVFPSLHEGFGNALLEAMASGLPVVASNCPYGPEEILRKKNINFGIILNSLIKYDSKTRLIWADTIIDLLLDKTKMLHYSKLSVLRANNFVYNKIIKDWFKFLT